MKLTNGDQGRPSGCSEAISRLIDGELDGTSCRELVDRLKADAEARQGWVLMNIACDAVRSSETAALHSSGFVARFSTALAAEPVILAPRALRQPQGIMRRVVLPTAAVAAAAAVLAVVALPLIRVQDQGVEIATNKDDIKRVSAPVAQPVDEDVIRSGVFEAYLDAHRESGAGPVTWRANEYVTNAALKTEPR